MSASRIQRFQEEKEVGRWFNEVLPRAKSRESCQPEQAVEPSFIIIPDVTADGVVEAPISQDSASSSLSSLVLTGSLSVVALERLTEEFKPAGILTM